MITIQPQTGFDNYDCKGQRREIAQKEVRLDGQLIGHLVDGALIIHRYFRPKHFEQIVDDVRKLESFDRVAQLPPPPHRLRTIQGDL